MLRSEHISPASSFYRNAAQWILIERLVKPKQLRIEILGGSYGLEAYTMASILHEGNNTNSRIISIDREEDCIRKAIEGGPYGVGNMTWGGFPLAPKHFFDKYIVIQNDEYRILPILKEYCSFQLADILDLGPENNDFVFMQNVTCHMYKEEAECALSVALHRCKVDGYVVLGGYDELRSEKLLYLMKNNLEPIMLGWRIIHESWLSRRDFYIQGNTEQWRLGPIDETIDPRLYCSIFRRIK